MMAEEIRAFVEYVEGKRKDNPMPPELEIRDLRAVLDIYAVSSRC
jgi:hypothetical protein